MGFTDVDSALTQEEGGQSARITTMKNDNDLLELKLQLETLRMVRPNNPVQYREQVKQIIRIGALIALLENGHAHGVSLVH